MQTFFKNCEAPVAAATFLLIFFSPNSFSYQSRAESRRAESNPAENCIIRGRIVDKDGNAVGGALMDTFRKEKHKIHSDSNGYFSIFSTSLEFHREFTWLTASTRDGATGRMNDIPLRPGVIDLGNVYISKPAPFSETVYSEDGEPIPGAFVSVSTDVYIKKILLLGCGLGAIPPPRTNEQGQFTIPDQTSGRKNVHIWRAGFADLEEKITISVDGSPEQKFTLQKAESLTIIGSVVDEAGTAIPNMDIRGYRDGIDPEMVSNTQSRADGSFTLTKIRRDENYYIHAANAEHTSDRTPVLLNTNNSKIIVRRRASADISFAISGEETNKIDGLWVVPVHSNVAGDVGRHPKNYYSTEGNGIWNVKLGVFRLSSDIGELAIAKDATLQIVAEVEKKLYISRPFLPGDGGSSILQMDPMPGGPIDGKYTLPKNPNRDWFPITFFIYNSGVSTMLYISSADKSGRFHFEWLPDGTHECILRDGTGESHSTSVTISQKDGRELLLNLPKPSTISGTITINGNKPGRSVPIVFYKKNRSL